MANNKNKDKVKNTDSNKKKNTPHDGLIKKVMENPIAAREFLEEYLPESFKTRIDLSTVKIEKESFVEKNLKKQLSDIVLSVKTKNNQKAFVYTLIEAQISPDYWIAFRLFKYILLLCERHIKDKDKLPLICPLVLYHVPRSMMLHLIYGSCLITQKKQKTFWVIITNLLICMLCLMMKLITTSI